MFFWNRHEVYIGNDMNKAMAIKTILKCNGIKFDTRLEGGNSACRARNVTGTVHGSLSAGTLYHIYVHKKDSEKANYLINHKD